MWWLALVFAGCTGLESGSRPTPEPRVAAPGPRVDGPVWTAQVTRARKAPPAWAGVDLPDSLARLTEAPRDWPPWGAYAQRICAGIDTTRSRWRLRLIGADGESWAPLAEGCPDPGLCTWLESHAARAQRPVSAGLRAAMATCGESSAPVSPPEGGEELSWVVWPWRRNGAIDHEATLGHLAAQAGLRGIRFRAVAPAPDAPVGRALTAIYAWYDGERVRVLARRGSEVSALQQHVGLLNVILADRERPERLSPVVLGDGSVVVGMGTAEELAQVASAGLLAPLGQLDPGPTPEAFMPGSLDTGFPLYPEVSGGGSN